MKLFLNNRTDDSILNIDGYRFERKDRQNCNAMPTDKEGGILIYVANHIDYIRRADLDTEDIESIWVEIKIKHSSSFLVCSVYRPPSSKTVWFELFSKQLEKAGANNEELYVMGDINIDIKDGQISNSTWKHTIEP